VGTVTTKNEMPASAAGSVVIFSVVFFSASPSTSFVRSWPRLSSSTRRGSMSKPTTCSNARANARATGKPT
jgi:hypothetical protein